MLFNNSESEGIFPECFKTAKIIPIFKSGYSNSSVYCAYKSSVYWFSALLHFGNIFYTLRPILHALKVRATIKIKGESVVLRVVNYIIFVSI